MKITMLLQPHVPDLDTEREIHNSFCSPNADNTFSFIFIQEKQKNHSANNHSAAIFNITCSKVELENLIETLKRGLHGFKAA